MASRQLRKLRKQQELLAPQEEAGHDDEAASEYVEAAQTKPRPNVFAAFAALEGEEDEDEDSDADHDEPQAETVEEPTPAPVRKSKSSKKKKRKKAAQAPAAAEPTGRATGDIDEIDQAIRELNLEPASKSRPADQHDTFVKSSERLSELLAINFHHLKVINEMRRVFGKEVIAAAQAEDESQANTTRSGRARQMPRDVDLETFLRGPPGKAISEVILRRNPFVDGRSYWPRASAGGLTMTTIGNPNGDSVEFSFSHDKFYDILEAKFFGLVQMYDPMQLVYFLQQNPYHVSTLIQVGKVAKQDQNSALAAELCERALFTFGRVTLSPFRKKLEQGKARIDFYRPENRQFWLAGYNYIKALIMKGTYRTALEWTKLFLGISPDDPYGMINWAHTLAIRSHEAQWLIDLCDTELLNDKAPRIQTAIYIRQTLVLAMLQQGDTAGAEAALVKGMAELPWLYGALFSALNLDTPKCIWGIKPRGADDELHTQLYIHAAKDLWNNAQATALLTKAGSVAQKVDVNALPPSPLVSLETARFIYLDNTPSLMAFVPHNLLHANPNFDFDPLPPQKELNIFSSKSQELPWVTTSRGDDFSTRLTQMERERVPGQLPGQIPEEQLRGLEERVNDENVPEEERGVLRRFLELILPFGVPNANNEHGLAGAAPRLPGSWDEEDEVDAWGQADDFEDEDDFGDGADVDDEDVPDLVQEDQNGFGGRTVDDDWR
jgi:hypothetical protein